VCAYTGAVRRNNQQLRGSDIQKRGGDYFARLSPRQGKINGARSHRPNDEHLVEQGFIQFVGEMGSGTSYFTRLALANCGPEPVQSPA